MSAWADAFPEYGKHGPYHSHLPRANRGLKGWARMDPPSSRLPLNWDTVAGICCLVREKYGEGTALMIAVAFDTYARPYELIGALWEDVTPPQPGFPLFALTLCPRRRGRPTKTGIYHDTVLIGEGIGGAHTLRPEILEAFAKFYRSRAHLHHPKDPLFGVSYATLLAAWAYGGDRLALQKGEAPPLRGSARGGISGRC